MSGLSGPILTYFLLLMDDVLLAHAGLPSTHWKLRALGGPQAAEGFEAALRQIITRTGSAHIHDGSLDTPDQNWRVGVTISRPESAPPGTDFFDINFNGRLSDPAPASATASSTATINQEFLHKLSHDLRTPLAALQLWIKVISEGDDEIPESVRDGLEAIRQCADEQQKLIAGLISRPLPS